ncbi:hemolysin family protein [Oceanobacillus sp. CF4.6]|uniref:hemolysin family protein n=1 Tax=Oceanobacillus sp. CF4.6 TaxID=3373080 RepID=UPI003EE5BEDC
MIIAIILLLFVSSFFSGSETALTATNKMRLQTKANNGDKKSAKLLKLVSKPSEFITSILIGNNIANIVLPTLVTTLAFQYGIDVALATAVLTIIIIIFSEVIPKSIAAAFPNKIAYLVYPIIRVAIFILKPITIVLNWLTGVITKTLSKGQTSTVSISKEDFHAMIDIAGLEGTFRKEETFRIKGVLDFQNLNVKDVLQTPRREIISLPSTATYDEVREIVMHHPFTRYPVHRKNIDNIIAVFHSKYLIQWSTEPEKSLKTFSDNDPLLLYEFHSMEWVLKKMTIDQKHMAIVLDEYGGTEGILTHENVIEAMIGLEIEDEIDIEIDQMVDKLTETEIICEGKITLHRLNTIFHIDLPEEEDVLAGYLLKEFNDFPEKEETIERENLTFKIMELEGRTIRKVQIIK